MNRTDLVIATGGLALAAAAAWAWTHAHPERAAARPYELVVRDVAGNPELREIRFRPLEPPRAGAIP